MRIALLPLAACVLHAQTFSGGTVSFSPAQSLTWSLGSTVLGQFTTINWGVGQGLTWNANPVGPTLTLTLAPDTSILPELNASNTYAAGAEQFLSASGSTAGLNLGSAPLPSAPILGDLAIDGSGNLEWYNGSGWVLGAAADTTLTAGAPVVGNGTNHLTLGTATGSGSFVLSTVPTIVNPVITSFANSTHDHSNAANGGSLSISAFPPPQPFATLPACSSAIEGSRADITNAPVNTWGAIVATGGGSYHVLVRCNGTNWTVLGI
jgi:hypothetical protein